MKKLLAGFAFLAFAGYAFAQSGTVGPFVLPPAPALGQTDAILVIPNAAPTAQSVFAAPGVIAGVAQYQYVVPVTAFTITATNGVNYVYLNPAGTLATGTFTLPASPADGQLLTLEDSQTQTAITIQANTGQTLTAGTYGLATPTALVANTKYQWIYFAKQAAWVRVF
jgi:hypothetical protein